MATIADLKAAADQALFAEAPEQALGLYSRMVEAQPANLDARLRVADALMALGQVQRAAVVYAALSRHAARSGYPLRALVALKMLSAIEPKLGVLLQDIATLYARDSARLGRSVRRALPDLNAPAPVETAPRPMRSDELAAHAERVAAGYESAGLVYPDKLIPIPVLSLLDKAEFGSVLEVLRLLRARPGTVILREGDPGRSFYVIARGTVSVTTGNERAPTLLAQLHDGAIFGEMALLSASPRTATVSAHTDCDLLEFDCSALVDAGATLGRLASALTSFAQERLLNTVVATATIFRPLDERQRNDLIKRFVAVQVDPGGVIIQQGSQGQGIYVVLRGEVRVTRSEGAGSIELARLGAGEMFGEISLLRHEPTTATVAASDKATTLLFLGRDYFDRLLQAVPELRTHLLHLSEERVMDMRISMAPGFTAPIKDEELEVDVVIDEES